MQVRINAPAALTTETSARQIARWLGVVCIVGAGAAALLISIPHTQRGGEMPVVVLAIVAFVTGVTMVTGRVDHWPAHRFHAVVAGVQLLITVGFLSLPDSANDAYLFYIWVAPLTAFFFRPRVAAVHAIGISLVLAVALWMHDATFAQSARIWLMTTGALVAVNSLVALAAVDVRSRDVAMSHAASHDHLTGLPNRALLAQRTQEALQRRSTDGGQVFMMLVDLNRFKLLNDTHGHLAGDDLLRKLAPRLIDATPVGSTVARLGGDEFAILVDDRDGTLQPLHVAEQLAQAWAEPIELTRVMIHTSASVGITVATDDDDPTSLLRNADAAMYRAKAEGRGGIGVYDEEQRAEVARHMDLEQALFDAVSASQLSIVYQPVVGLDDGSVHGAEALLRWEHPEMGIVSPGEFIPLAEESGAIDEIGLWVIDQALRQLVEWRANGVIDSAFTIDVNLSGAQLHGDLAHQVSALLDKHGVEPSALTLELTESILMRAGAEAGTVLNSLNELGVGLALDDFGSGHSSLSYLYQAPVQIVKIDQSFVGGMSTDPTRRAIVGAVVRLAVELGLVVIAEGVETDEQIALLKELGCARAQGFSFGGPMPTGAMTVHLVRAQVAAGR